MAQGPIFVTYMYAGKNLLDTRVHVIPRQGDYVGIKIHRSNEVAETTYKVTHVLHVTEISQGMDSTEVYVYLEEAELPPV